MSLSNKEKQTRRERKPSIDLEMIQYGGKIPPQARELESAVLGALMLEREAFDKISTILRPETFYTDANQRIFKAIQDLTSRNQAVDLLTVVEALRSSEDLDMVGGPYYITKLTDAVVSGANIEAHARIVLQKYLSREMIRIGVEITMRAYQDTDDVFDMMDHAEECLSGLRFGNIQGGYKRLRDLMLENLKAIEELRLREDGLTGVTSEFEDLDMVTSGWQDTDLIILAARPSVGKSAFALTLAKSAANGSKKVPVGLFSLEMNDRSLVNRILSAESRVWMWRLRSGRIGESEMRSLYDAAGRLDKCPIFIDDTSGITIQNLKAKARLMVKRDNVGLIIVDYLQLVNVPGIVNREQQISTISRELKGLAKELHVPVIALSQLSREIEKRADPRPMLSDLRESGAIEQDADVVMFIHKPTDAQKAEAAELLNTFYLDIAKHRNGSLAKFIGEFTGEDQHHDFLKVIDGKMNAVGSSWKPVTVQPVLNFYESTKEQTSGVADPLDDAPF